MKILMMQTKITTVVIIYSMVFVLAVTCKWGAKSKNVRTFLAISTDLPSFGPNCTSDLNLTHYSASLPFNLGGGGLAQKKSINSMCTLFI